MSNDLNSILLEGVISSARFYMDSLPYVHQQVESATLMVTTTREFKVDGERKTESLTVTVHTAPGTRLAARLEESAPLEGRRVRAVGRLTEFAVIAEHIELIRPHAHRHDQAEAARVSDEVRSAE